MKIREIPLNVPNILSLYRILSFPFVLIIALAGHEKLFAFMIWFNLTTDILDGWLARRLNQVTEAGAILDGLADTGTYLLGLAGIFIFKWIDFQPYNITFFIFIVFFIASRLFSFIKLGRFFGFQTYGGKTAGYIHGAFFLILFILGFYPVLYYIMIISGLIIFSENILITIILDKSESNVKGLYWVLKNRNR